MLSLDSKEICNLCFLENGKAPKNPYRLKVNGQTLNCIAYFSKANNIDVYLFHGNGENASDYITTYGNIFKKLKCNIFISEYRGYGESSGNASLTNILSDAEEIYKVTNISHKRTIVFGKSFGAIPAIHIATKFQVRKLIIDHGIFDVKSWLLSRLRSLSGQTENILKEIEQQLNNKIKISNFYGDLLVFHSKYDTLVDIQHAKQLIESSSTKNTKLVQYTNSDHNNYLNINLEEYYNELKKFIYDMKN